MKMWARILLGSLMFAAAGPAPAQQPKPLFSTNDPIRLIIQAPLSTLTRNRTQDRPVAGTLTDPSGQNLPITLSLRGLTRRMSEICDFPPLRVEFTAPPPAASVFAGEKKLKLVTHCRNGSTGQQDALLEYAAYRMLNVLTPRSFRVRLANIDYRDADGRPMVARAGFFIEPLGDVAKRNGMPVTHAGERIPVDYLSAPDAARYALFQHMIGNHDWSMRAGPAGSECCHNAELIGRAAPGSVVPIPYDFDYSGLVGAPYATPPDELHISDVRQRFYRGYCMHNPQVVAEAARMRSEQPAILGVLNEVPGLDAGTRSRAASYLSGFFAEIGTDDSLTRKVLNRCVGSS